MLNELERPIGSRKRIKVVGRGRGSGHGKTSCRGEKGQNARASGGVRPGFEGGQMPLIRRIPKRGFTFIPKPKYEVVSLSRLGIFGSGTEITPEILRQARIVRKKKSLVKMLDGDLKHPFKVKAHAFSKAALRTIQTLGGSAEEIRPAWRQAGLPKRQAG
ncbi:MAG: 50S ribosomal protein L15 [Candidatus Omnitrophica bacterium]|nr:50S ribosomal protein L15 [Candidatus Omnitrophota bacterium]